jgi:hypothetical protein
MCSVQSESLDGSSSVDTIDERLNEVGDRNNMIRVLVVLLCAAFCVHQIDLLPPDCPRMMTLIRCRALVHSHILLHGDEFVLFKF